VFIQISDIKEIFLIFFDHLTYLLLYLNIVMYYLHTYKICQHNLFYKSNNKYSGNIVLFKLQRETFYPKRFLRGFFSVYRRNISDKNCLHRGWINIIYYI